jgi:hypothetical protein
LRVVVSPKIRILKIGGTFWTKDIAIWKKLLLARPKLRLASQF